MIWAAIWVAKGKEWRTGAFLSPARRPNHGAGLTKPRSLARRPNRGASVGCVGMGRLRCSMRSAQQFPRHGKSDQPLRGRDS